MARMTAEQAAEHGKDLSFEKVWAMFEETDRRMAESRAETERLMAESRKETDRRMAESRAETERLMAESRKETDRLMVESRKETERLMAESRKESDRRMAKIEHLMAELSKNVGGLNRSLGELIETLIAARLWEKFPQYGFVRHYRRLPIYDETNRLRTDIDILLSNTDKVMAVEVKRELSNTADVQYHLERMELIRTYPPPGVMNKELFGAIAGGVVDADTALYAYKAGFYVLELTGENVSLIPPPDGFKPGVW